MPKLTMPAAELRQELDFQEAPWCHPIGAAPHDPPVNVCKTLVSPNDSPVLIRADHIFTNLSVVDRSGAASTESAEGHSSGGASPFLVVLVFALIVAFTATLYRRRSVASHEQAGKR